MTLIINIVITIIIIIIIIITIITFIIVEGSRIYFCIIEISIDVAVDVFYRFCYHRDVVCMEVMLYREIPESRV